MSTLKNTTTSLSEDVYYSDSSIYWNDYEPVRKHINLLQTGEVDCDWIDHFHKFSKKKSFNKTLMLCSGNGFLEREIQRRYSSFESLDGYDFLEGFVNEAKKISKKNGYNFTYFQEDLNYVKLKKNNYDLCINYAGLHHISHLDYLLRQVYDSLKDQGYFICNDYIGPHRNQYSYELMEQIDALNSRLPKKYQKDLGYAHLPTMIKTDPSEAIHSELIMDTLKRYFDIEYYKPYGGCLAYEILSNNRSLFHNSNKQKDLIYKVLSEDQFYMEKTNKTFFAYFICKKKNKLPSLKVLNNFILKEKIREKNARKNNNYYYKLNYFQKLQLRLSNLELVKFHKEDYINKLLKKYDELQKQNDELKNKLYQLSKILNFLERIKMLKLLKFILKKFIK